MYGDAVPERPHMVVTNVLIMEWINQCGAPTASITIQKSWILLMTAMEAYAGGANASNVDSVLAPMNVRSWQHLSSSSRMEPAKSSTVKNWPAASVSRASSDRSLLQISNG